MRATSKTVKYLFTLALILALGSLAWGQNGVINGVATDFTNRLLASPLVTVCAANATVNLAAAPGQQCSPTVPIYSGASPSSTVLANPLTGDANGRFTYWVPPGQYIQQVYGAGNTASQTIIVAPDASALVLTELQSDPATPGLNNGIGTDQIYALSGQICVKNSSGVKTCISGSTSNVNTFAGRTGTVVPTLGDYTAAQVTNAFDLTAANTLTAVTAPVGNPPAGKIYYWIDSGTGQITCRNSGGTSCNPASGSVTTLSFPSTPSWFSAVVANPTSTPAVTVTATAPLPNQVLAGNVAYGSGSGPITTRALGGQDMPAWAIQALDNSINSASIDANGNPNFLAVTGASGVAGNNIGVLCTTVNLVLGIAGKQMNCTADRLAVSLGGVDALYYVFAIGDTAAGSLGAADFITSNIPPLYGPTQPACSNGGNIANGGGGNFPAASASNPQYWFNTGNGSMNVCTSSGGAFVQTSYAGAPFPAVLLGACHGTGAASDKCVTDPLGMTPARRLVLFGDGHDGNLQLTSGTTTKDGKFDFNSCYLNGGAILNHTAAAQNNNTTGLILHCQLPTVIMGNALISTNGKGRVHNGGTANNGNGGQNGGMGGCGGNGGGGNTGTGGAGGVESLMWSPNVSTSTPSATATNTGGVNGCNVSSTVAVANLPFVDEPFVSFFMGSSGGNGGGDGTNFGGFAGDGGGVFLGKFPALLVVGSGGTCGTNMSCIQSSGTAGATPGVAGTGNGGGGGGGAGTAEVYAGFASFENCTVAQVNAGTCSQLLAAAGAGGTRNGGTAGNGGTGGSGVPKFKKAF